MAIRIQERCISRKDVVNCLQNGEIIEDYPTDFPHPSCLVFGNTLDNKIIHVVTFSTCVIIVKNVPCEECEQCGEKYYSDEVMEKLEIIVNRAKELASEVFVTDYNKKVA